MVDQQDYRNKLEQANAQLARAQAEYDTAKLSFDRTQALYSSKSATKPEYDSANAQLQSAAAATASAKAQIDDARIALAYCELRAPFDGWIVDRSVDVGSLVGPATKGFSIANTNSGESGVRRPRYLHASSEAGPAHNNYDGGAAAAFHRPGYEHFAGGRSQEPRVLGGSDDSKSAQPVEVRHDRFAFTGRRTDWRRRVTAVPLTAVVLDTEPPPALQSCWLRETVTLRRSGYARLNLATLLAT